MGLSATAIFRPRGDLGRFVESTITPAVRASVEASCHLIEGKAKDFAPVDTGALRDSITTQIDELPKTIRGVVAPHVHYAIYQEFGTYKMKAQPFMRPAVDESRDAINEIFRNNIGVALNA